MARDNDINTNKNKGVQQSAALDSNKQRASNKGTSSDQGNSLLANAPILSSVLKKAVRNVPSKNKSTSVSNDKNDKNGAGLNDKNASVNEVHSDGQLGDDEEVPLVGGIAAKVKNLDGKIIGKEDKEEKQGRTVHFADQVEVSHTEQHRDVEVGHGMSSGVDEAAHGSIMQAAQASNNSQPKSNANQPLVDNVGCVNNNDASAVGNGRGHESAKPAPKLSYASMFQSKNAFKSINICELRNEEHVDGAHVAIPLKEIDDVSARFANTLYGYFIGKRLAFPIVENYVKNTWAKFGLQRVMLNNGFFLFQFSSKEGMDNVLEAGPWLIRSIPIFLNIWTPNTTLAKEEVTSAPVWLKLYNVPIVAYTEVGLSLITTQIGKPIMLDSYTSSMCVKSWGRNTYARALVEVSSLKELMDHVVVAVPYPNGSGHSLVRIEIEYEWQPPRCAECKIFDHNDGACPKRVKQANVKSNTDEEGFIEVTRKGKGKGTTNGKMNDGVRLAKPKVTVNYRWQPVKTTNKGSDGASSSKGNNANINSNASKKGGEHGTTDLHVSGINTDSRVPNGGADSNVVGQQVVSDVPTNKTFIHDDLSDIITKNPFGSLSEVVTDSEFGGDDISFHGDSGVHVVDNESDDEVDEHIECGKPAMGTTYGKTTNSSSASVNIIDKLKEASTSSVGGSHV